MGQVEPLPPATLAPPRLKGRYVVTCQLGRGAQARVYLAFDGRLRQWRAVKVLAANFLDDEHVRGRFEQEAQAMARLSHPNLLRVVDVDHDGRTPFMVMELARGGSIADWMKRNGRLPPQLAVRVAAQCCDGLGHAHSVGVIHRDVKPHNLLIREDGSVVLTDFGIARVGDGASLTATGSVMGTFAFMAPEQRSDAKAVDLRADVYALGATLFTMLTGKTSGELFFAESRDELLAGVPDALRPVILTACCYEREQRYASMAALKEDLERRAIRLPTDPPDQRLTDAPIALPDGPPSRLSPRSGVEDLLKALAGDDQAATRLSRGATLDQVEQPTTLYNDSPVLPYRMPTIDPPRRKPAASELSEEDVPEYVDASTFERRPRRERVVVPARDEPAPAPDRGNPLVGVGAVVLAVALLVLLALGFGVVTKIRAAASVEDAGVALVRAVEEQELVVTELAALGGDGARLHELWFATRDATGPAKVEAALAFADLAAAEAGRVGAEGLLQAQASHLAALRRSWDEAVTHRDEVRRSPLARATGDLGL